MPDHSPRRHSREGGNPVPFGSRVVSQRRWVPDIATRFRDDEQKQSARALKTGWTVVSVSQIADHCLGKMLDKQKNKGALRPYLRNLNVRWFDFDLSDVLEMRFEDGEADRYQTRKGDLIVCEGGYPGRAAIWDSDEPVFLQKALHRVRFHEPERAKWVLYWLYLSDMDGTLTASFNGAGIQHFTKAALARFEVPLPPLEEQKRIVAVLDQTFAALDGARANAEANLADADELLENSLNAIFQKLAMTSTAMALEDAVHPECKLSYGIVQPGDAVEGGLPVVRPVDLKQRLITLSGLKSISPDRASGYARTALVGGELLLSVRGSTGELSIASPELAGGNVTRGIVPIRFAADEVLSEFAYFQMRSRFVRDQIAAKTYGAALMQINIKDVRKIRFFVPTIPRQRAVVEHAEALNARSRMLQAAYEQTLADSAALRQSILQKAFAGELT